MLKMTLIGNIGQDAKIRETNGRTSINFSVAENQKYTNSEGVKVEKTTWVNCTIWRDPGQSVKVAEFLLAGTKVYAEGRPAVHFYENKEKQQSISLDLHVINIELIGKKITGSESEPSGDTAITAGSPQEAAQNIQEDDLPF